MPSPRLLLIKPRWLTRKTLADSVRSLRREFPGASITLLADAEPDGEDVEFVPMPDLWRDPRGQVVATVRRLRRVRFEEAIVLTDERGVQLGAHELRFWAFAARARIRRVYRFGPLRLADPEVLRRVGRALLAQAVTHTIRLRVSLRSRRGAHHSTSPALPEKEVKACTVCRTSLELVTDPGQSSFGRCPDCGSRFLLRWPGNPVSGIRSGRSSARRRCLLEAFLYLNAAARRCGESPRTYLDVGWGSPHFVEAAQRMGWTAERVDLLPTEGVSVGVSNLVELSSRPSHQQFQFVTLLNVLEYAPDPVALLKEVSSHLAPGGICLVRLVTALAPATGIPSSVEAPPALLSEAALRNAVRDAGLAFAEIGSSITQERALDIWLTHEDAN